MNFVLYESHSTLRRWNQIADLGTDTSASAAATRARRRRINEAKQSLRELRIELAALNHRVGTRIELKDIDFECLDVVTRHGPLSPSSLARRLGIHLATMTGILNRLEDGGWITRDRVESDRRAVLVRAVPDKQRDIYRLYDGMNRSLDDILERMSDDDIDIVLDFLNKCARAGHSATDQLAQDAEQT
jgi:DNA-binding MarR family transcriptional regulator